MGPENSLEAIVASFAAGADGVEIDVRLTADAVLVLAHDPVIDGPDGEKFRISQTPFADLHGPWAPALEEVLEVVPVDRLVVIELKGHPWEAGHDPREPAAHVLAELLVPVGGRRLVVSSFNPFALHVVRAEAPGTRTAILTAEAFDLGSNLAAALEGGHEECHVPANLLDEPFIGVAHTAGRRVVAWTVDDPERIRTFATWGLDGVICDDPAAARSTLAAGN